ncbi:MAG: LytTR family transcriptional regulator DNA-binding domain-containing protein [Actinomycetota bacterium]|nr:LytTR family transcriptional regulator DNA-binding domain-containing protein [Actinomycetota bacterium]
MSETVHQDRRRSSALDHRARRTALADAWERFAGGEDAVPGVDDEILASWYRSRDVHRIDPSRWTASRGPAPRARQSPHPEVFATLGVAAASLVAHHPPVGAIVTDGDGWPVTSLPGPCGAPRVEACWSEAASGTNAVGVGLVGRGPSVVCGPEHWCRPLHGWSCAAYAVRDVITRDTIATIAIFARDVADVLGLSDDLCARGRAIESDLRSGAVRDGLALVNAFARVSRRHRGTVLAVDDAGGVVAANDEVRRWLPRLPSGYLLDPGRRWRPSAPHVRRFLDRAGTAARASPGWTGRGELGSAFTGTSEMLEVRPVIASSGPVGWLLLGGRHGECPIGLPDAPGDGRPDGDECGHGGRITAVRGGTVVLLAPAEIRYAEADGHTVWLDTDLGRVRATTRGIDNVAAELAAAGLVRVHRSFVVNIDRVRGIEVVKGGGLFLSTDPECDERIPVSRPYTGRIRRALGI